MVCKYKGRVIMTMNFINFIVNNTKLRMQALLTEYRIHYQATTNRVSGTLPSYY